MTAMMRTISHTQSLRCPPRIHLVPQMLAARPPSSVYHNKQRVLLALLVAMGGRTREVHVEIRHRLLRRLHMLQGKQCRLGDAEIESSDSSSKVRVLTKFNVRAAPVFVRFCKIILIHCVPVLKNMFTLLLIRGGVICIWPFFDRNYTIYEYCIYVCC